MNNLPNKTYLLTFIVIIILIIIIFPLIFSYRLISGGDYSLLTPTYLMFLFHNSFSSWVSSYNFGQNATALLNYAPYNFVVGTAASLINWNGIIIERIFWWIPFFALAFVSNFFLRKLLPTNNVGFLSTFIFLFNTYTLMMLGGGQISGVGLAYVMVPIVLVSFIQLINTLNFDGSKGFLGSKEIVRKSLICGLLFALQAVFDLRFAYVTLFAVGIYAFLKIVTKISRKNIVMLIPFIIYAFIVPLCITGLIHAFWIVPVLALHQNPVAQVGAAYNSVQSVQYFSFAKLENSLSLLHPNWPQNIFGEVSFMRPQFLLLPIIAFMSLLFVKREKKESWYIIYFALLAIIGAFLSKGSTDPFGGIYLWMFGHVPGFVMFRDPTKWYILQITAFCVLIPFTLYELSEFLKKYIKGKLKNIIFPIIVSLFILYTIILIYPAVLGKLTGTFISQPIPLDYQKLNTFISSQNSYSRVLWLPTRQKYGIYPLNHPAISADDFFQIYSPKDLMKAISQPSTKTILADSSIKYIVIPEDTDGTIYLKDRKFDKKQYELYIATIEKLHWLKKIDGFGDNYVFELVNTKSHFWSPNMYIVIQNDELDQTNYRVKVQNGKKGQRIVFSETYDPLWKAEIGNTLLSSQEFDGRYNSFILPKNGNYTLTVFYKTQQWVTRGIIISIIAVFIVVGLLIVI